MKILFVTNNYTPYSGGVVSSINATVHALQKKGHEVRIATFQFLAYHDDPAHVYRIPTFFKFIYKKNRMILGWWSKKHIKKIMKDFAPDIVHVHHPFVLGPVAVSLARMYKIPTLFTYHTMYEKYTHYIPMPRLWVEKMLTWRVKQFMQSVDGIVAPSTYIYEQIQLLNKSAAKWIIPSGLQDRFAQLSFKKKTYSQGTFKLIVVSRLRKEKNVSAALDICARLPRHVHLTIVGYGNQEAALRTYAYKQLNLSNERVTFIIDPPKDSLPALYQEAHLFIFTSQTDTQGLVLAESMAASTPVLAFPGPGQQDIIISGINGFILDSVSAMVHCIQNIMNNPTLYAQLQQGAYETSQKYHAEILCDQLLAAYDQLITTDYVRYGTYESSGVKSHDGSNLRANKKP